MTNTHFLVRFWGVRGSYPTPGPQTVRHGGNTSCVEVQVGTHTLILDAGSGIIRLGHELLRRAAGKGLSVTLLITHGHGDHLLGIPFFAPLYERRSNINFFGPRLAGQSIEELVTPLMSPPYFPVDMRKLPSQRTFHTLQDKEHILWDKGGRMPVVLHEQEDTGEAEVRIIARLTNSHPMDGAIIYRIEYDGRRLIFATDVEWGDYCDPDFVAFVEGADLLIHDAQYTSDEYRRGKKGFGHSTLEMAVAMAQAAHVRNLVLFHHDPTYDDDKLDSIEMEARKHFAPTRSAYEGMTIEL